jgi:hypothetical protein
MSGRGRERRLARARGAGPRAGRGALVQLAVLGGVLALLLASWDEVGARTAGCVGRVAEGGGTAAHGEAEGARGGRHETPEAGAFGVRVERRPATGP